MKKRFHPGFIIILFTLVIQALCGLASATGRSGAVYLFPVEGTIDAGTVLFLRRAFGGIDSPEGAVILQFNTLGGYVDAALEISELIKESPLPVYSYVKSRALSTGAHLALSTKALFMENPDIISHKFLIRASMPERPLRYYL